MADKDGNKYRNPKYNRKRTWVEKEILKRGWTDRNMWVWVSHGSKKGKDFHKDTLDEIFDNARYRLGSHHIESIAMACNVSYFEVLDWIRLDANPESMTRKQFEIYKRRITALSNADRIRWYLAMMVRKGIPFLEILDAATEEYNFKKENKYQDKKKWVYQNLISKGIRIDPSKKNPNKKD